MAALAPVLSVRLCTSGPRANGCRTSSPYGLRADSEICGVFEHFFPAKDCNAGVSHSL